MKTVSALAGAALALALTWIPTQAAQAWAARAASSSSWPSACNGSAAKISTVTGAKVCWLADGERFYVKDTKADGRRAGVQFEVSVHNEGAFIDNGLCYSTLGANTTGLCNYSWAEGYDIVFSAGTCDGDAKWGCSELGNWTEARSWTAGRT